MVFRCHCNQIGNKIDACVGFKIVPVYLESYLCRGTIAMLIDKT